MTLTRASHFLGKTFYKAHKKSIVLHYCIICGGNNSKGQKESEKCLEWSDVMDLTPWPLGSLTFLVLRNVSCDLKHKGKQTPTANTKVNRHQLQTQRVIFLQLFRSLQITKEVHVLRAHTSPIGWWDNMLRNEIHVQWACTFYKIRCLQQKIQSIETQSQHRSITDIVK